MKRKTKLVLFFSFFLVLSFQACSGSFYAMNDNDLGLQQFASTTNPKGFFSCQPDAVSSTAIRRLSKAEYSNTVKDVFGASVASEVQPLLDTLFDDVLRLKVDDFSKIINGNQMSGYQAIAEKVALYYGSSLDHAAELAGACIKTAPLSTACKTDFIAKIGALAFRRPLTSAELQNLDLKVFSLTAAPEESVANVVYYLMLSPFFLTHFEGGEPNQPDSDFIELTSYEVAARLSYRLWDAPPDQTLRDAAAQNKLKTLADVGTQVDRMLQDPRARIKMRDFFRFWLQPKAFGEQNYNPEFIGEIGNLAQFNAEVEKEMYEFIDYIVWVKQGSFQDLLTDNISFARGPASAAVYGHAPAPEGGSAKMGSGRQGLLMRTPMLASKSTDSNIVKRGVFIRARVLCDQIGAPSGIQITDPTLAGDQAKVNYSNRERIHKATYNTGCITCHSNINPYGNLFEHYDSLGRFRTIEKSFSNTTGQFLAEHPIDTKVDAIVVDQNEGSLSMNEPNELVSQITRVNKAPACFVRHLYRYYQLRDEQLDKDGCVLQDMLNAAKGYAGDYQNASIIKVLRDSVVNREIFRRRL